MALQLSDTVRSALADAFESTIGTTPILRIYSGTPPASVATALSGNTLLAEMTLPSDWMGAAAAGVKTISGTWQDASADATGTASFFRIFNAAGTTAHAQGTVSQNAANGGTGDIQLQQATAGIVAGQQVTISAFTYTQGGA